MRRIGRAQLARYANVKVLDVEGSDAWRVSGGFVASLSDGSRVGAQKLLLAGGLVDVLPAIPGLPELWGRGAYPCPYCDAWEVRERRLAVYGRGSEAMALCRALLGWSRDVVLFSDGPCDLSQADQRALRAHDIELREKRVIELEERSGRLWRVVLEGGERVERDAIFFATKQQQQSPLAQKLGCPVSPRGVIDTDDWESTSVAGLYVAGDASHDVQLAIVAAAEGARAAFDINRSLAREAFARLAHVADANFPQPPDG